MATKTKYDTTLTLPSDREILMTRKFEAPREIVWEILTDPDLIPKWWGFARDATEVKKMDVRKAASGSSSRARPGARSSTSTASTARSLGPSVLSTRSLSETCRPVTASWRSRSSRRAA